VTEEARQLSVKMTAELELELYLETAACNPISN
jgi:hypothetical protein